jgi:peptidoglycan hydrolase-like protein with peptidoglycan-binding domain
MPTIKKGQKGEEVEHLQKHINSTLNKAELDWLKVKVDGDAGPLTFKAARLAASWQGLSTEHLKEIGSGVITDEVLEILMGQRERSEEMKKRSEDRLKHFKRIREEHKKPPEDADGVSKWGDKMVASWMVGARQGPDGSTTNWLQKSVDHGWGGGLFSGWRSPAHSEELCFTLCDAPMCSGTCAGRSSNHSQTGAPSWGAIDVEETASFGRIQAQIGSPLKNALPDDPNHYSFTGR